MFLPITFRPNCLSMKTAWPRRKRGKNPDFPLSASEHRLAGWLPWRHFFPACRPIGIRTWHSWWCSIWHRTIRASLPILSAAIPACRPSRSRTAWPYSPTASTSSLQGMTWHFSMARCNCSSPANLTAGASRSISFSARSLRTSASGRSASCFREPAATARSACARSRGRPEWSWPRPLLRPSLTACRGARLPRAWWITSFPPQRCPPS